MKTKIILLVTLIAVFFTCQNLQAQFKYGVHAAMSLETQAELGQLWNNQEINPGFLFGGLLNYSFGQRLSLQTEFNYQEKGIKSKSTLESAEVVTVRKFNYLSVPLLVKGTFNSELGLPEKWNVTGFAGPYLGFLTSAKSNTKIGGNTTTTNIDSQAEKQDWGFTFGGGVSRKLNNGGAIIAELRYEMGCNKIDKQAPGIRNKVIGLSIGYCF